MSGLPRPIAYVGRRPLYHFELGHTMPVIADLVHSFEPWVPERIHYEWQGKGRTIPTGRMRPLVPFR